MEKSTARPVVLLLASPHLGNRGRDVFNTQFDDMLSPTRQREIRECVEGLARFRPTKVALEVATDRDDALNEDYRRYRANAFTPTADEVHQIGFRLAATLGHERVYAIDWNEGMGDLGIVFDFAQANQPELYEQIVPAGARAADEEQARSATTSVRDLLRRANDHASLRRSHQIYLTLARVGAGKRYVGVDWVKQWYERNLIIFVNLSRITTTEDRTLVLYGAGHIPLLTQFVHDSGLYTLEDAETYLR